MYTYTDTLNVRVALAQSLFQIHFWEMSRIFHELLSFVSDVS
jgi:hypothetical protein